MIRGFRYACMSNERVKLCLTRCEDAAAFIRMTPPSDDWRAATDWCERTDLESGAEEEPWFGAAPDQCCLLQQLCVCVCVCARPYKSQMLSVFLPYWLCLIRCRTHHYVSPLLFMTVLHSSCGHYIFVLWFLLLSIFFPRLFSAVADSMLPYFHTWCRLSANLECRSEMCCTRRGLLKKTGR